MYRTHLYIWDDWRGGTWKWEQAADFIVRDLGSCLEIEREFTSPGLNSLPWFSTSSQIWYY